MPSLTLGSCCCCIDLRTGSLIIGYLNLISNIGFIIRIIPVLAEGANYPHSKGHEDVGVVAGVVIGLILNLGFNIALLVGIHKNKRGAVKAYLIFSLILIILFIILLLTFFGLMVSDMGAGIMVMVVMCSVPLVLAIYYLLVIRSYYYEMDVSTPTYNNA